MTTKLVFRIHYEALEAPLYRDGERYTAEVESETPDGARAALKSRFERLHPRCRLHVHKIKRLKEAGDAR